jgi:hypothetical protein
VRARDFTPRGGPLSTAHAENVKRPDRASGLAPCRFAGSPMQDELADKGIRIQAVLPGATATDLWETAGLPWQ